MNLLNKDFDYIKIKLASPKRILNWSYRKLPNGQFIGEIQKSETINYRTFKPEMGGLFCERIFGPNKSFECSCGKYKLIRYEGLICERCGVELTESRVRRHRMGHINLIYPVTHVWYINSRPNYLALLLEIEQCEKRLDTGWLPIFLFFEKNYKKNEDYLFFQFKEFFQNLIINYRIKHIYKILNYFEIIKKFFGIHNTINNLKKSIDSIDLYFEIYNAHNYLKPKDALELYLRIKNQKFQLENLKKKLSKNLNKSILKSSKIHLLDNRIKRIKLTSFSYFLAENELIFYGIHWDLQYYRRSREIGFTGYPLKPYSPVIENTEKLTIPKYLLRTTPSYLIGTVLIRKELEQLNLSIEIWKTRKFISICSKILKKQNPIYNFSKWFRKWELQRIYKLRDQSIKRVRILENLLATNSNPAWIILTILPVIPPGLRPMIQLEGGRFATSDLNELYRRIITRNNRLLRLLEIDAPQLIIRNEKRMLQEAVDTLIDNGKRGKIVLNANNRPLKSLSDIIKGKQGRFRQNLLGKRVDYSGRSVIVVGPNLKLNQCGLPFEMALELFQPFLIRELINQNFANNMKIAKNLIQKNEDIIKTVLTLVLTKHPIFLNRAPTLHRLGIQAFEPILVPGRSIKLHPLVCSSFNADFDGDQMAVHIPLSSESKAECYMLMLTPYNFLSPANGEPIILPSQDMVLGCYYLTVLNLSNLSNSNHYFSNINDVILAYNQQKIELHTNVWVRYQNEYKKFSKLIKKINLTDKSIIEYYDDRQIRKDSNGNLIVQYLKTTPGRIIFNFTILQTLNLLNLKNLE